jgi:pimeloyl-ACP methyl ester carboxylesterase
MAEFTPDDVVELQHGVVLRAVDVSGSADDVTRSPDDRAPVRDVISADPTGFLTAAGAPAALLGPAMDSSGMRLRLTIPLTDLGSTQRAPTRRGPSSPHVELEVEAPPRPDEGQVVLEVDGTGHVRWHIPRNPSQTNNPHRGPTRQVFDIPIDQFPTGAAGPADRGIVGFGLRKILHLVRFPIERAAELVAEHLVRLWEERRRPYGLHLLGPNGLTPAATPNPHGPLLILIHGTFSTGHAFDGLYADAPWVTKVCAGYAGTLVFEHPSMHVPPADNARHLLAHLPAGVELDVVSHSRGGLVARELAALTPVRRLAQVAAPNAGTVLASEERLGDLLDTVTNLVSLFPDGAGLAVLEGVLEVVKQIALGARRGLPGLTSMDPASDVLTRLNGTPHTIGSLHAIGTDHQPLPSAPMAARALDTVVDRLFGQPNDLVVPTEGMHRAGTFAVGAPFLLPEGLGVTHNSYFASAEVRRELARFLG